MSWSLTQSSVPSHACCTSLVAGRRGASWFEVVRSCLFCSVCAPCRVFTCTLTVAVHCRPFPTATALWRSTSGLPLWRTVLRPSSTSRRPRTPTLPLKGSVSVHEREENGRRHRLGASSDDRLPKKKKLTLVPWGQRSYSDTQSFLFFSHTA